MKRLNCYYCNKDFSGNVFYKHMLNIHNVSKEALPQLYVNTFLGGIWPKCQCGKCNLDLQYHSWHDPFPAKFIRGHNAALDTCFKNPEIIKKCVEKRLEGYETGRNNVWNLGLTKKTDERVAKSAFNISTTLNQKYADGLLEDWRKNDTEKAQSAAIKISNTKKQNYAKGITKSWNEGLTKHTHPSLASAAKKNSVLAKNKFKLTEKEFLERVNAQDKFEFLDEYQNYTTRRVGRLKFRCKSCEGIQFKSLAMLEETPICFLCCPKESKGQLDLFDFVRSINSNAILSDRQVIAPKEIDVLIPGKLGIEYHGLFWHSDNFPNSEIFCNVKNELCSKQNLPLLQIFEDEWRDKNVVIKSMIKNRLGLIDKKIYARKCEIKQLNSVERKLFFDTNHLENDTVSKICFGLIYDNQVVAAMSLRKPFHKKHVSKLEVARFATKMNWSIPGALSRLTKKACQWAFQNGYKTLMTYVDKRIGEGIGYQKSGWSLISMTVPRFWWSDGNHRFNRFSIKADKLKKLSEQDVAKQMGVYRVYGTSNLLFEIQI